MTARKRTEKKTGEQRVRQVVEIKVVEDGKEMLKPWHEQRGNRQPPEELVSKRQQRQEPHSMRAFHDQSVADVVKQRIKDHSDQAWASFQKLVSLGLDESFLCSLLVTINLTFPSYSQFSFQDLIGFHRKQFPKVLNRMRKCASDIESLPFKFLRDIPPQPGSGTETDKSRPQAVMLPSLLRALANQLERAASANRKRGRPHYDAALAVLVGRVPERTDGNYYHGHVANVVEAMRGDVYSIQAHKDWVRKHSRLVRNPW